jgi:hypothetical protein
VQKKELLLEFLTIAQCDLLRPACSRCKRLRLVCDYPDLQHGQIFVNRNMRNPRAKAVDIISTTTTEKKHKPAESPCSKQTMTALEMHHRNQNNSMPTPLNSGAVDRMQLLSSIFDLHFPKARGPTIPGQGPASWINSLHGITATNSAYDLSLKALCLAQAGSWHHDTALVKDSHRLYGSALRGLREALSHRKLEAPEATLAIIIILSTYEVSLPHA